MGKFKSRKFWMAVVGAGLVLMNEGLGLNIDGEVVLAFAGLLMSFIFVEGYTDAQNAKASQLRYLNSQSQPLGHPESCQCDECWNGQEDKIQL